MTDSKTAAELLAELNDNEDYIRACKLKEQIYWNLGSFGERRKVLY